MHAREISSASFHLVIQNGLLPLQAEELFNYHEAEDIIADCIKQYHEKFGNQGN